MQRQLIILFISALLCICVGSPGAMAQSELEIQASEWNTTAQEAEETLQKATVSDDAFEELRTRLAEQRGEAFAIVEQGNIQSLTLQARLDALGPPPAEGEEEAELVAKRRAELVAELAVADAPVLAARQAFNRADVLIAEIDKYLRSNELARIAKRDPSPLIPTLWIPALLELTTYAGQVASEIRGTALPSQIPSSLILTFVGLFILMFAQPRIIRYLERAAKSADRSWRRRLTVVLVLAARIVLPLIAAACLYLAVSTLDIASYSARTIGAIGLTLPLFIILPYWLGDLLFAPQAPDRRVIAIDDNSALRAARMCVALGIVLAVEACAEVAEGDYVFSPGTRSIVAAIVVYAGSLCLWRLAAILIRAERSENSDKVQTDQDAAGGIDFLVLVSRLVQIAAVAAAVTATIGYVDIARQAMVPAILSLALFGLAVAVYRLVMSILFAIVGNEHMDDWALVAMLPVAVGLLLIFALVPLLALIWGARLSDITEIWILLSQGIEVGGTRISLGVVVILIAVFSAGVFLTRWSQRLLKATVLPKTRLDSGGKTAIITGLGYAGIVLSALVAVSAAGLDLSTLAIVAGALSLGVGFGLQSIVSNFVSGIILLVERPVKVGDWIEVSDVSGIVRKIAVRATRIETFDRHEVIVPNADLIAGKVTNMTLSSKSGRLVVPVGVAYGSDLEQTRQILIDAAKGNKAILPNPEPAVLFMGLGDSSLDFELRCFLMDVQSVLSIRSELLFEIYNALGKAGIEIPFPQRDINLRNVDDIARALIPNGEPAVTKSGA